MSPPRNTGPDGDSAQTPQQMARRERRVHPLPQASAGGQRSRPEHKANQRTRNFAAARKLKNGEWGMGSGEWGQRSYFTTSPLPTPHSPFPTPFSACFDLKSPTAS